jgi:Sulfotransferase domain
MNLRQAANRSFLRLPPGWRRHVLHGMGRYAPWEARFDFTPPPLAPGQVAGLPDFVGIGVQKAGTTWWYEQIVAHPGVFAPSGVHKERHFFDRFGARPMTAADAADYRGWFPRPPGMLAGEWTPDYFTFPWVPALLARAAPDARLLLLLRDPVERFRSGLAHQVRMGQALTGPVLADAVQRGNYRDALETWLEHFDAAQLLVLQHERSVRHPQDELARTFAHLGLPPVTPTPIPTPTTSTRPDRASPPVAPPAGRARRELGDDVVDALVHTYEPGVVAIARSVPDIDLALWPNFAYLADADGAAESSSPTSRR